MLMRTDLMFDTPIRFFGKQVRPTFLITGIKLNVCDLLVGDFLGVI